jgi:hypothetical protein
MITVTGEHTDIQALDLIDVYDNLVVELDKLRALAELLQGMGYEADTDTLGGIGLLVRDAESRMRTILELAVSRKRAGTRADPSLPVD